MNAVKKNAGVMKLDHASMQELVYFIMTPFEIALAPLYRRNCLSSWVREELRWKRFKIQYTHNPERAERRQEGVKRVVQRTPKTAFSNILDLDLHSHSFGHVLYPQIETMLHFREYTWNSSHHMIDAASLLYPSSSVRRAASFTDIVTDVPDW